MSREKKVEVMPGYRVNQIPQERAPIADFTANLPIGMTEIREASNMTSISMTVAGKLMAGLIFTSHQKVGGLNVGLVYLFDANTARMLAARLLETADFLDGGTGKQ